MFEVDNNPSLLARSSASLEQPLETKEKNAVPETSSLASEPTDDKSPPTHAEQVLPASADPVQEALAREPQESKEIALQEAHTENKSLRRSRGLSLVQEVQANLVKGWTFG